MSTNATRHTIEDLREHLFETLKDLRDKKNPMDVARARAVSEVAQTIIESAKVEVEHMKTTKSTGTGFIAIAEAGGGEPEHQGRGVTRTTVPHPSGLGTVTRHTTR